MQFYRLAPGARFEFVGRQFQKLAMSMAEDQQQRIGCIFHGPTEVTPIGEPLLLPPEVAEKWKPFDLEHWAHHIEPSSIERGNWGKTEPR